MYVNKKKKKIKKSDVHKFSQPLLNTLLKQLWQQLQPRVFLSMMLLAWHIYFWTVSTILFWKTFQAPSCWMGRVDFQISQELLSRVQVWALGGHSRTFTEFSRSHSFVILAVCLGLLSCWKVNLLPIILCTELFFNSYEFFSPCRWKIPPQHEDATSTV